MDVYKWVVKEDTLYLKTPPQNKKDKNKLSYYLMEELKLRNLDKKSFTAEGLLGDAPQEIKIGPVVEVDLDGKCLVQISQSGLKASIVLYPPISNGYELKIDDIKGKLNDQGVTYGINDVRIGMALNKKTLIREDVAFGKDAKPGTNAQIKYHFNPEGLDIMPQELEDGRVDFYNVNLIQNIKAKQLLFEKTPATKGIPGIKVTGEPISVENGQDITLPVGRNVIIDDNRLRGYADCAGHVVIVDNKVSVLPVYEVSGDVDFSTGNIQYSGNVIVRGNVRENFYVRCTGDIEIYGNIEGGHAIASGNIIIKNGIRGLQKSTVTAGGNVYVEFIEHANVKAGIDLVVNRAIMHSHVDAQGSIQVGGKRGLIVGGVSRAGHEIRCKNMGSNLATATKIEVGIAPETRNEYAKAIKEFNTLRDNLDKTTKALGIIDKIYQQTGALPVDKQVLYQRLCKTKKELVARKNVLKVEKIELEETLTTLDSSFIEITQHLHSGVMIVIGQTSKLIDADYYAVRLVLDGADIKIFTISG